MEAGGSKVEGKQVLDGNQGGKGGKKWKKKKEKKEKKEKKIERVAKGSNGGQESWAVRSESGGPIAGGDSGAGTAKETRGWTRERKPKKQFQTQSQSQSLEELRAPIQALEAPNAPFPGPSKGPTRPSPSKKAKALVSKSRLKTPSVTQKAKFSIDVRVTPPESITIYHPLAGPPPKSIPQASALKLIATPINPLLDPQPRPSLDPKDQIIKGLEYGPGC
ncbi:hypothetical protein PAXRUDRAFT_22247 [Paxillus rubicundulus Ve08.2h10]|uniref:Uncharacterized protein n=1 Tax=Paxillus rubicundulus Ve08.2h10 TaxID=930991 RepID=A0A0D0CNE4_9AGAM|nr:hypothetical protein PAXRUDRAFT_22247 [Paxillus rubicundulus Ve08.2h10]